MKISFSTLGCPTWSWNDIIAMTKDLGFNGIEIRGIENEIYAPNCGPFLSVNIDKTKEVLKEKGLEIPCLTSASYIFDKNNIEKQMKEGIDYIALAQKLGVKYVRVLGDEQPYPGENIDFEFVASNLSELADYADGRNVDVLIETNGIFANSRTILKLMERVSKKNVGILWDVNHPFRYMDEPVEDTYRILKPFIKHLHIKDSIMENGKIEYKMVGNGDVPLKSVLDMLKRDNYAGYVSLEWVKRWNNNLESPAIALPHFVNYIKKYI
ncbi:MAG: sugar phosphate isomerase/epimerase family protein [Vulcanibacillus sp.]